MQPVIGVTTSFNRDDDYYITRPSYIELIRQAGGLPVILPLGVGDDQFADMLAICDGLLLTGGDDVDPAHYGEVKQEFCGDIAYERDFMEKALIKRAVELDMPVFGICRGIQILNVALGGTLYQDIGNQLSTDGTLHEQGEPYSEPHHCVDIVEGSPLDMLWHRREVMVNSMHHQGIKDLAPGLEAMAYAKEGFVEAVDMPSHSFVRAVQWHPERMCMPQAREEVRAPQLAMVRQFIDACAANKNSGDK